MYFVFDCDRYNRGCLVYWVLNMAAAPAVHETVQLAIPRHAFSVDICRAFRFKKLKL